MSAKPNLAEYETYLRREIIRRGCDESALDATIAAIMASRSHPVPCDCRVCYLPPSRKGVPTLGARVVERTPEYVRIILGPDSRHPRIYHMIPSWSASDCPIISYWMVPDMPQGLPA